MGVKQMRDVLFSEYIFGIEWGKNGKIHKIKANIHLGSFNQLYLVSTQMLHPQKSNPLNPHKKATSSFMLTKFITQYFYRFSSATKELFYFMFFDVDTKSSRRSASRKLETQKTSKIFCFLLFLRPQIKTDH